MKEIIIEVDENGEIQLTATGFKGKSCIVESQFIKDMLGEEISKKLTSAYYEKDGVKITEHLKTR